MQAPVLPHPFHVYFEYKIGDEVVIRINERDGATWFRRARIAGVYSTGDPSYKENRFYNGAYGNHEDLFSISEKPLPSFIDMPEMAIVKRL